MILAGTTDAYKTLDMKGIDTTLANFAEKMDAQLQDLAAIFEQFIDEALVKVISICGMWDKTKGVYLVENLTKWLGAYKMQLFLHFKSFGNTALGTSNLWGGVDMLAQ